MKTKTLHFQAVNISRNKAVPDHAVKACAYRSGLNLQDAKTGERHSYENRGGILATGIFAPQNSPGWMHDDSQARVWERFANEVERVEDGHNRRGSALLGKDFISAAPRELTPEQNWQMGQNFIQRLTDRGLAVAVGFHVQQASDGGDNPHFHFFVPMREVSKQGFEGRYRTLDAPGKGKANPELMTLRREYYACVNKALEEAGVTGIYYDPEKQEDTLPGIHKGKAVTALERKGIETEQGRRARRVQLENRARPFFASLHHSAERYYGFEPGANALEKMHNGLNREQEYLANPDAGGDGWNVPTASGWQQYETAREQETKQAYRR